ncbi:alkaline phosphatase family protein, partial [Nocardioides sp.]|uniref:alkaline phosphatase family protein n=1 Tax=Nocardioides sp. TaxID=35761 RepID=UPI00286E6AEC
MCEPTHQNRRPAFGHGLDDIRTGRRSLLKVVGAGGAAVAISTAIGAAPAAAVRPPRRAYVLVLDGCRPDEVTTPLMPRAAALRDGGLNHPFASSMPIMETIPNHVMMMTGVRPDRSGVPANSVYDHTEGVIRNLDRPTDITIGTVIERLNAAGLTTGTVLSKEYLYGVFGERATHRWEPAPVVPVSGHAPDQATMDAALAMIEQHDPSMVFVNLGDIDRVGHSDLTGPLSLRAARQAALATTDLQVGRFVDALTRSGRWQESIVIVLADHSMDWSRPDSVVHLQPVLDADPLLAGQVVIADNGGADLLYWTGDPAARG